MEINLERWGGSVIDHSWLYQRSQALGRMDNGSGLCLSSHHSIFPVEIPPLVNKPSSSTPCPRAFGRQSTVQMHPAVCFKWWQMFFITAKEPLVQVARQSF